MDRMMADGKSTQRYAQIKKIVFPPMATPVADGAGYLSQPSLWQDRIAFIAEGDVWITTISPSSSSTSSSSSKQLACLPPRRLTMTGECAWPCFSPDGRRVAFARETAGLVEEVCVVATAGGRQRVLCHFPGAAVVRG